MQCYVPICENSSRNSSTSKEITFYEFPSEEKRRAAWFLALGGYQHQWSELAICEQHFNPCDFSTTNNGLKTLKTDAIPLALRTCAICLDTNSKLYSLSIYKLEEAYTNITGLSYDGNLSRALCAACAQRLISCNILRDRSLMAHSLMMKLVETSSLTIQNIKLKREKLLQIPNLVEKIFLPDDFKIQENNKDGALIKNEVDKVERTETSNGIHIEVKREVDLTEDEITELSNAIDIQLKREVEFRESVIKYEVDEDIINESEFDNANEVNETSAMGNEYLDGNSFENCGVTLNCTGCFEDFEDKDKNIKRREKHKGNDHSALCHYREVGHATKLESPAEISMNDEFKIKQRHTSSKGNENTIDSHTPQLLEPNTKRKRERSIGIYNSKSQAKSKTNKHADPILLQGKEKQNFKRSRKSDSNVISAKNKTITDNVDEKQSIDTDKTDNKEKDIDSNKLNDDKRRIVNKYKFACHICNFETNHENYLECHLLLHSSNVNQKYVYKCTQCAYITNIEQNLATHLTIHTGVKPYSCKICEYKTAFKRNLISHNRTHTGEKPYSCSKCSYTCSVKYYLISHMRTHSEDLPYSCNICDYKCNIKRKLTRHIRKHSGEKPYTCDVCNFKCSQQSNLRAHMRTHTGEKPFSCSECEYRCTKKCSLDRHMRIHTGEKPYSCNICNHKTTTQYNLTTHIRTHTGEKPFACNLCQNRYCSLKHLVKHKQTHR